MLAIQPARSAASRLFDLSTRVWFAVVFIGQLVFAYYILMLYGKAGVQGNLQKWNAQTTHGYQVDDLLGNIIFGIHVGLAAIITLGGPLQLIPQLRKLVPKFHRINGRVYIFSAFIISFAGLYLSWVRGSVGGLTGTVFITINGFIILFCASNTLRFALKRQFDIHSRWALRLFLAVSGVWFFRVGLMLWLAIHQAPVGFDPDTFQGPFLNFLYVLVYIMPQVFAELYFRTKDSQNQTLKVATSGFLIISALGISAGIFTATMGMWLPTL